MTSKTFVVTGANRGIGHATALALAKLGHRVVLTARSEADAERAAAGLRALVTGAKLEPRALDLCSLDSVRACAAELEALPLDGVLHNAGVMQQSRERRLTGDGYEETLQVNALGPFLLTQRLRPLLEERRARVVFVTSRLHLPGSRGAPVDFDFDDPQLARGYHPERAYKNSKLAVLWVTYELARRAKASTANAVCPGFVPATAQASTHGFERFLLRYVMPLMPFSRSLADASSAFVEMLVDPQLEGVTGKFYADHREDVSSPESRDATKAGRFWELAEKLTEARPVRS